MAWMPQPLMLRPLGVGERIDATFKIWGRNFLAMAKAMLVIAVPAGVVEAIVSLSSSTSSTTQFNSDSLTTTSTDRSAALGGQTVNLVINFLVAAIAIATLYRIIGDAYLGQPVNWRRALRAGARRMLSAAWISILVALLAALPVLVVVLAVVAAVAAGSHGFAVLLGVVLGLGTIVGLVWFVVSTRLATPVMMLENVRGAAAIRRSISLVRGSWWSVFGTLFLMELIVLIASSVLSVLLVAVAVASSGDPVATAVINFIVNTVKLVIFTPLTASLAVVLTIDMRVRKEGFDLEFLAASMGTAAGPNALSFIRPQPPYGQAPYGQPGGGYGQPPYGPPPAYGRPPVPPAYGPPGAHGQQPPPPYGQPPVAPFGPGVQSVQPAEPAPPVAPQAVPGGPPPSAVPGGQPPPPPAAPPPPVPPQPPAPPNPPTPPPA